MNISAVLRELGLPHIFGYKPAPNYQAAILPAIDRFLSTNPAVLTPSPRAAALTGLAEAASLYIDPPPSKAPLKPERSGDLERLVRKFDPVERDFRNRALGRAGEALILEFERNRLRREDRPDLARRVRWVSEEDGDGAGYDILSYGSDGHERLLEVKTTNGAAATPFFLSRNEHALSIERADAFRITRVFDFVRTPRAFELEPPLAEHVTLTTETWRASF